MQSCFREIWGDPDDVIANMDWFEGQDWRWTMAWKRQPSAEEQRQITVLQGMLQNHKPARNETEHILWNGKQSFRTKELVSEAWKVRLHNTSVDHLAATVWMKLAPPKVEFMVWLALLGKLNTKDMLTRKGIISQEQNLCSFCSHCAETSDHLLLQCDASWQVWCTIAEGWNLRMENHGTFRQHYEWWVSRMTTSKMRKKLLIVSFFAITWSLWNERNLVVFHDHHLNLNSLCHIVKWRIALWSKAWKKQPPYSAEELVRHFSDMSRLIP